jgi:epoxyqueuosine reductase
VRLQQRDDLSAARLADLVRLDDAGFRARFAGSPIKRTGRDRFVRNVLIAIGNSNEPQLAAEAIRLLEDSSPLVRAMAVWASARLVSRDRLAQLARERLSREADADVRLEWKRALPPDPAVVAA